MDDEIKRHIRRILQLEIQRLQLYRIRRQQLFRYVELCNMENSINQEMSDIGAGLAHLVLDNASPR